jgi:hypothetical protein
LHGALYTDNSVPCICRWRPVSRAGNGLETGSPAAKSELPPYDRVVHGFSLSLDGRCTSRQLLLHLEHHVPTPERRATQAGLHWNNRWSALWVDPSLSFTRVHWNIHQRVDGSSGQQSPRSPSIFQCVTPKSHGFERSVSCGIPRKVWSKLNLSNSPSTRLFLGLLDQQPLLNPDGRPPASASVSFFLGAIQSSRIWAWQYGILGAGSQERVRREGGTSSITLSETFQR